ncbi:GNAT family N-acetyltransferase [Spirillospora sp. NPDC047279]|uniref:GNAT family N-acetyltransferase n=1 Tax=Spirillospora sp. NPDC047279 TaxID=3155478 RepID=UPI0034006C25
MELEELWPLLGLRITTERLTLRPVPEQDLPRLAAAARTLRGSADRYQLPWLYGPSPQLERDLLQRHWRARAHWRTDSWHLQLGIYHDQALIGLQEIWATDFPLRRVVETGSWIRLDQQRHGYGTQARASVLEFAFTTLDAREARSDHLDGNLASRAVSLRLGYQPNGSRIVVRDGRPVREHSLMLDHTTWSQRRPQPHRARLGGMPRLLRP